MILWDRITQAWTDVEALSPWPRLQQLTLSHQRASERWAAAVAATLRACPILTTLDLSDLWWRVPVADADAAVDMPPGAICSALCSCARLSSITICFVPLGPAGAALFCQELQDHPALRKLRLYDVGLESGDANAIRRLHALVPFVTSVYK